MLLAHITSRVAGRAHDDLLSRKGGRGWPYFAVLDAEGGVLARHDGGRGFETIADRAAEFLALRERAKADRDARVELTFQNIELGNLALADARFPETLTDDEQRRLDRLRADDAIERAAAAWRQDQDDAALGVTYLRLFELGQTPSTDLHFRGFWTRAMEAAIQEQRIDLLEKAVEHLKTLPDVDWLEDYETRLKKIREEQS